MSLAIKDTTQTNIEKRKKLSAEEIYKIDAEHIWHPYSSINNSVPVFAVKSAHGVYLELYGGQKLLDGMSSWWSTLHGYNHPYITDAVKHQMDDLTHVMFGGLTHEPAAYLTQQLVELTPNNLTKVFLSDSGSVAVEVAMKMAIQYWHAKGAAQKNKMLSLQNGYHGDTIGAMSVCDPTTGMHHLFQQTVTKQFFAKQPPCRFNEDCSDEQFENFRQILRANIDSIAAVIVEPIVQGAGGMYFYSPEFLTRVRTLCDELNVLLIADEIATGFGRTGKLFACEHANIAPDIMCLGKTLTGGTVTLAATLCTDEVSATIASASPGIFMHGPTFMGNPLACAAASASIDLLMQSNWQENVQRIQTALIEGLAPCKTLNGVKDVRILGSIGVVEMIEPVDMQKIQASFVQHGIWIRPFGRLVYTMPAYIMTNEEIKRLTHGIYTVLQLEQQGV